MYSASDWFILIAFPLSDSPCNRMKVVPFKQNLLFRNLLLLSTTSLATLTYLSSSQNFPRASDFNERMNPLLPVPLARSDKRLRHEKWALYGGLFSLSTQSIKPNYLVIPFTDAAWQFLQKLIPLKVEK